MIKKFFCIAAIAALFAACSGSDSNPSNTEDNNQNNPGTQQIPGGNNTNNGSQGNSSCDAAPVLGECNFKKECNVWKFTYSTWKITDVYTWTDESTVKYESYMNAFHMDEDDEILENQNRDALYEEILSICKSLQNAN